MSLGETVSEPPMPVTGASAGIGLFEWAPASGELWWDETASQILAAAPDESPLETWHRRVHPDDAPRLLSAFIGFDLGEDVCRMVMDDGSTRRLLLRATHVVADAAGAPYKIGGVALDVSNTHDQSMRVLSMLDSISDGFVTLDQQFRCTFMNRRAEEILAMPRELVVGRHLWEVFPDGPGSEFDRVYRRVMRDRVPETLEAFYPEPLNMWIEVRAQPSAEGLTLYFQDATRPRAQRLERERLLAAERRAREDAERARADTERALELVAHQAAHDALTGLVNRSEFCRLAEQRLGDPACGSVTAMFIDLDRFKLVNDTLGHAAGDALLVEVAGRLGVVVEERDVLARLGGDEFVVLLMARSPAAAEAVAEQVLAALRHPLDVGGRSLTTSASIGLAKATPGATVETLLRDADVALYRAKDNGRDQAAWFDREAHEALVRRIGLEHDLRAAIDRDELQLSYQPMYDVATGRVVAVEALSRWAHLRLGPVPPGVFVPLAEDTGLMRALGAQVITSACRQAARWAAVPDFTVWVNVSARQLDVPGLADFMLGEIGRAGITPGRIGVEVTESVMSDERCALTELTRLAEAGVRIAIDDFGTGHSSLARLYRFPIDVLKIDRSFVHDIETDRGMAAVRAVVQLTEALGLSTVAEGIETPRQLELVREAGCQVGAGFLLGRPVTPDTVTPPRGPLRYRHPERPRGYDDEPPDERTPGRRRADGRDHPAGRLRPRRRPDLRRDPGRLDLQAGRRLVRPGRVPLAPPHLRLGRAPFPPAEHRHPRRHQGRHRARAAPRRERRPRHPAADQRGQAGVRLGPGPGHPPRRPEGQRAAQRAHLARRHRAGQPDAGRPAPRRQDRGPRRRGEALLPGHRARRGGRRRRPAPLLRHEGPPAAGDRGLLRAEARAGGVAEPDHLVRLAARVGAAGAPRTGPRLPEKDGAPPPSEGRGPTQDEGRTAGWLPWKLPPFQRVAPSATPETPNRQTCVRVYVVRRAGRRVGMNP